MHVCKAKCIYGEATFLVIYYYIIRECFILKKNWFNKSVEETKEILDIDLKNGLNADEVLNMD